MTTTIPRTHRTRRAAVVAGLLGVALLCVAVLGAAAGCTAVPASPAAPPPVTVAPTATAPTPATVPPDSPAPDASSPPRCTTPGLAGSLGDAGAAAGSVYRALVLTNTTARSCELRGFPGVSYVAGDDGHQVGPAAEMSGERGGEVVLAPGGSATAQLQLVNVGNFDEAVCMPTPVRGLRIYPPGDTASLLVPMEGTGCAGTPPGPQLSVRTVTAG